MQSDTLKADHGQEITSFSQLADQSEANTEKLAFLFSKVDQFMEEFHKGPKPQKEAEGKPDVPLYTSTFQQIMINNNRQYQLLNRLEERIENILHIIGKPKS